MKQLLFIIGFSILSLNISFGQIILSQRFIDSIDWGYTTRWDIEQKLGKGEYLTKKITGPENEQDHELGLVRGNGLLYSSSGITFTCAGDGELIEGIEFRKPYMGLFGTSQTIEVGKTRLCDAFPKIDTFSKNEFSTEAGSQYWSFLVNCFRFYVKKPFEDWHENIDLKTAVNIPPFKARLLYYKNQPISIITCNCPDYYTKFQQIPLRENDLLYFKANYEPKGETHLNCYELGWPKSVPRVFIPFYALTGGGKSDTIKQGYWKEYSPKHVLIYEGAYNDGNRVGIFKYYDTDGKLILVKKYHSYPLKLICFILAISAIIILFFIWRNKKIRSNYKDN